MSIPTEPGHLAMPINFLAYGKNQLAQARFKAGTSRPRVNQAKLAGKCWLPVQANIIICLIFSRHSMEVFTGLNTWANARIIN